MNVIKPFNGIVFNPEKIGNMDDVLTPPYDIIDEKMQDDFYNRHDYNFVKIDYGKKFDTDNEENNVYSRARDYFNDWLEKEVLIKHPKAAFYVLKQEFKFEGKSYEKIGFYGLYKISDYSLDTIMPHEKTQSGPKEDRFRLTMSCNAYFSAVYAVFEDKKLSIEHLIKNTPMRELFSFVDYQHVKNTLFISDDEDVNKRISQLMVDKRLIIADGHHRYETALRVKRELKEKGINKESADYCLMYFSNLSDPNLLILPTHRLVSDTELDENNFYSFLSKYFRLTEINDSEIKQCYNSIKTSADTSILCALKNKKLLLTPLPDQLNELFPSDMPEVLKALDVNILFYGILKPAFNITEEDLKNQKKISYCKDEFEALRLVASGEKRAAFILQYPKVENLIKVIQIKETLPQKSTYFYPKIPSGSVIYNF